MIFGWYLCSYSSDTRVIFSVSTGNCLNFQIWTGNLVISLGWLYTTSFLPISVNHTNNLLHFYLWQYFFTENCEYEIVTKLLLYHFLLSLWENTLLEKGVKRSMGRNNITAKSPRSLLGKISVGPTLWWHEILPRELESTIVLNLGTLHIGGSV
jgi:hypothetical protein